MWQSFQAECRLDGQTPCDCCDELTTIDGVSVTLAVTDDPDRVHVYIPGVRGDVVLDPTLRGMLDALIVGDMDPRIVGDYLTERYL